MAYRNVTGPVRLANDTNMVEGTVQAMLAYPVSDDDDLIVPQTVTATIADGAFSLTLASGAKYNFRVYDSADILLWSFIALVPADSEDDITLSEVFSESRS